MPRGLTTTMPIRLPEPDWDAPLDMEWYRQNVPGHLLVKGMSIQAVVDAVTALGRTLAMPQQFISVKEYPMLDMVETLIKAVQGPLADLPPREALRRIGNHQLDQLRNNLLFRVMFAGLGQSLGIHAAAMLAPRAWGTATKHEVVEILVNEPGCVRLHIREMWNFPDCFQLGILEGALKAFNVNPRMGVQLLSRTEAEIEATW